MSTADFLIVRPLVLTDAQITSTSVPELIVPTYISGATYAIGDRAGLAPVNGSPQAVYQSLQSANIGHALTDVAWWYAVGSVYPLYGAGITYALGDTVYDVSVDVHQAYESLTTTNLGNALSDATKWLPLGATNAHKMLDTSYSNQTSNGESIAMVVAPNVLLNNITIFNAIGSDVTITQTLSGYSRTISLVTHVVNNWFDWFYTQPINADDVTFNDIPPYISGILTITISNAGGIAKCGVITFGSSRVLGVTQWEFSKSINDYSSIAEDSFGNITLTRRLYSERLTVNVHVPSGFESEVTRILKDARATPLAVIASTEYSMAIMYCFLGAWHVPVSIRGRTATIELKGLT